MPADEKEQEKEGIFPEVRAAESRYMPVILRDTLEGTGQWGQVRVLPPDGTGMDVYVNARIMHSDGRELELDVTVSDAAGARLVPQAVPGRGRHARLQGRRVAAA